MKKLLFLAGGSIVVSILFDIIYLNTHIDTFHYIYHVFNLLGCLGLLYFSVKTALKRK